MSGGFTFTESRQQRLFHCRGSSAPHIFRGRHRQQTAQRLLIRQPAAAAFTARRMRQPFAARDGVHQHAARDIRDHALKFRTIHTRHPLELDLFAANLSASRARARCNRDRTVPTAHPNARAAST